jgi:hypothetical protein
MTITVQLPCQAASEFSGMHLGMAIARADTIVPISNACRCTDMGTGIADWQGMDNLARRRRR